MRISVGGNARGGWLIDIHDGTNTSAYSPKAPDRDKATELAMAMHRKAFGLPETEPVSEAI